MDLKKKQFTTEVAGRTLTLEVSRLADQANGAVVAKYGGTVVLAAVVMSHHDKMGDYFPLMVDFEEKFYAVGKILGSRFMRREGKASDGAILSGRLIDRSIRPLFDGRMRREVQLVTTVLAYDEENDPEFVALMAASAALATSDIPWNGPLAALRVARTHGEVILNPLNKHLNDSIEFDSFVSGTTGRINMIEVEGRETTEETFLEALAIAQKEIDRLIEWQKGVVKEIGQPKAEVFLAEPNAELKQEVKAFLSDKLEAAVYTKEKVDRQSKIGLLKKEMVAMLKEKARTEKEIEEADSLFEEEINDLIHAKILNEEKRPDGRKLDEVRELHAETGLFEYTHGSALFVRGNTQALAVTTLGAPDDAQLIETMRVSTKKKFMLHYNFPHYSVGEVGPNRGPGRREIGHGNLAEKAVRNLIPNNETFPYAIRVVSEILSSNGSSSMATVCASILSLMDAGVPIKNMAAGIAMGLMVESSKDKVQNPNALKYKILTDIQGPEDHHGDMDFKVAGTDKGVTAIQMDVKIDGVTHDMLRDGLAQAKAARLHILAAMKLGLAAPRPALSVHAPIIMSTMVPVDRIGEVVGPGGKMINGIISRTGVTSIDIEQDGRVFVTGSTPESVQAALNEVNGVVREFKVGEIIEGIVVKTLEFGAIVEFDGHDGMIHVSELKEGYVKNVEDVIKVGDKVRAKIVRIERGKIGLSIKQL